jgi:acetyl-CoA synthetase
MWYHRVIGGKRCPIVDTWWQTETGGIMISSIPGSTETKPGSATQPFPGIHADIFDDDGNSLRGKGGGFLVLTHPWPGMLRGIWRDKERFQETDWSKYDNTYFAGDGAHCDKSGYFWIVGRIDDVMNVSGHRIGTMEVESALVSSVDVAEAAVVGRPDEITGTAIVAFVSPKQTATPDEALVQRLKQHVTKEIGAIARPTEIRFTNALPKTRSGKIMRRLLRDIASGREIGGDTSTLEDFSVLAKLRESDED